MRVRRSGLSPEDSKHFDKAHTTTLPEHDLTIALSDPPDGAIDARVPHALNNSLERYDWDSVELTFHPCFSVRSPGDFTVTEVGGDGEPPDITVVTPLDDWNVRLSLSEQIKPGAWTRITYVPAALSVEIGSLPGDVNGDGVSLPADILGLIDDLDGQAEEPMEAWQCDVDRSGRCTAQDILRVIDVLNGAEAYEVWNGRSLPDRP